MREGVLKETGSGMLQCKLSCTAGQATGVKAGFLGHQQAGNKLRQRQA